MADEETAIPGGGKSAKITRGALQVVGGAIPYIGGFLSAVAGVWSEKEQDKVNRFFEHWVQMIHDELREKEKTVVEVMARLDLQDEKITERLESKEYQSLIKKTFRDWAGVESEEKRVLIRNILANAAASGRSGWTGTNPRGGFPYEASHLILRDAVAGRCRGGVREERRRKGRRDQDGRAHPQHGRGQDDVIFARILKSPRCSPSALLASG